MQSTRHAWLIMPWWCLADPNLCDKHGQTPLMMASYQGHTSAAQTLVEAGAGINIVDKVPGADACTHTLTPTSADGM